MKTQTLREVKNNLSKVIEDLPESGPVLITKNGTVRALLIPVDEETDLEALILSNSRKFWDLFDRSARTKPWTSFDNL
ncbi:MAG TPA: type II toxin-antitoxin system Phd/YefM family antitoxin [Vicinamibacteria bacterium]|nr:type II toxin-antitoxin system Phd/YefM family antitoxin [Vicinamibacteria bacterium]